MSSNDYPDAAWRKSRRSNGQAECVEVGHVVNMILVRDTKDRDGGTLSISADAWRTFAGGIKHSEASHQ